MGGGLKILPDHHVDVRTIPFVSIGPDAGKMILTLRIGGPQSPLGTSLLALK